MHRRRNKDVATQGTSRVALLWLLALLQLPLPLFAAGDSELRKWHEGPIRYIAVKEEVQEYKRLEGDSARALFIERFWRRRDPTPDTLTNEYRQLFWERVQQANASFLDSTKPGWMTDRGKIWILYGRPDTIDNSSPGFENYGSYEVWRYRDVGIAYYFRDVDGLGRFRLVWQEGI